MSHTVQTLDPGPLNNKIKNFVPVRTNAHTDTKILSMRVAPPEFLAP